MALIQQLNIWQPALWTQYEYDPMGRPYQITQPDGSIISTSFNGFTADGIETVVTQQRISKDSTGAPSGTEYLTTKEYKNSQGKRVKVIDNLGNQANYKYDTYGNLLQVTRFDQNNNPVVIAMQYDKQGRKLSMDDPDMGHWEYRYNSFGELKWQKDAKGQITELTYDKLGRNITRTEPDINNGTVTTFWKYDSAIHGVGKLASVCKPYVNFTCVLDQSGSHQEV